MKAPEGPRHVNDLTCHCQAFWLGNILIHSDARVPENLAVTMDAWMDVFGEQSFETEDPTPTTCQVTITAVE